MLSRRSQQQQQRGVGVGDVPSARVLVVGEAGVGKSALVRALLALDPPRARERAAGGEPREREEAPVRTVGVDVHALVLGGDDAGAECGAGAPCVVELWDVGGERHAAHAAARRGALYDRGFAGVLLVWDARRPRTRHALRGWAADLARHASFDRGGAFHPAAAGGGGSSSVGAAGISAADGQGDADCELEAMLAGDMPSEPSSPSPAAVGAGWMGTTPSSVTGGGGSAGVSAGGGALPELPVPTLVVANKCDGGEPSGVPPGDVRASARAGSVDADAWAMFLHDVVRRSAAGSGTFRGFG